MGDRKDKPTHLVLPSQEGGPMIRFYRRCTGVSPAYGCTSARFLTICSRQTSAIPLHKSVPCISLLTMLASDLCNRACRKEVYAGGKIPRCSDSAGQSQ